MPLAPGCCEWLATKPISETALNAREGRLALRDNQRGIAGSKRVLFEHSSHMAHVEEANRCR